MKDSNKNILLESYSENEITLISERLLGIIDKQKATDDSEKKTLIDSMKKVTEGKGFVLTNSK